MATPSDFTTERLSFHRHGLDDFADCVAMWGDAETTRHIGGVPSTAEESWARLLRGVGHWALLGYGSWVIRDRVSGRFAGDVGFKRFQRGLDPALDVLPELGWVLAPWARGRGLATEAVFGALAWGDARFGWPEVLCMIDPENAASLSVAEKAGFSAFSRADYKTKPVILFRRVSSAA
jgi:RimJ/RimL family protein N-acetyltransferase